MEMVIPGRGEGSGFLVGQRPAGSLLLPRNTLSTSRERRAGKKAAKGEQQPKSSRGRKKVTREQPKSSHRAVEDQPKSSRRAAE